MVTKRQILRINDEHIRRNIILLILSIFVPFIFIKKIKPKIYDEVSLGRFIEVKQFTDELTCINE